jgi:uncharacterized protein YerC
MQVSLRDTLKTARLDFDSRLAKVLIARPDLSYTEIENEFGISETVIRRVMKQFCIGTVTGTSGSVSATVGAVALTVQ